MQESSRCDLAVCLILFNDEKEVLLIKRSNTGFGDGNYSFPGGKIEKEESLKKAMTREAFEELDIYIKPDALSLAHLMHLAPTADHNEYLLFYFTTDQFTGTIINKEPHKCSDVQFFPVDQLPSNLLPETREGLRAYLEGTVYAEYYWS